VTARLRQLLSNTAHQLQQQVFPLDEAAARFRHQRVLVHPFPNGNGRHVRLMADCLFKQNGSEAFTWGARQDLAAAGTARQRYIAALRAADAGDIAPLLVFVRS
jgi:fido (protein-threonine AMPylation protein)